MNNLLKCRGCGELHEAEAIAQASDRRRIESARMLAELAATIERYRLYNNAVAAAQLRRRPMGG